MLLHCYLTSSQCSAAGHRLLHAMAALKAASNYTQFWQLRKATTTRKIGSSKTIRNSYNSLVTTIRNFNSSIKLYEICSSKIYFLLYEILTALKI